MSTWQSWLVLLALGLAIGVFAAWGAGWLVKHTTYKFTMRGRKR